MSQDQVNESKTESRGHEFSPHGMASSLLKCGFTVDQIESRIAAPDQFINTCLGDHSVLCDKVEPVMERLKDLYLREQVKALLRYSPFLGITKGAERLGIATNDYKFIYNSLIGTGEIRFTMEIPSWTTNVELSKPLRKHIVK